MTGVSAFPNLHAKLAELVDGIEIVATRRLGNRDEARDAAQESIARLLDRVHAGAIRSEDELVPVAWGIARHVIADVLRDRGRTERAPDDIASARAGPLDELVSDEDVRIVQRALGQLSESDSELLHRCFVLGERIGQIAEALGEPAERLRKRKSRALERLGEVLRPPSDADGHKSTTPPMDQT